MTKTEVISGNEATAVVREPRPFLWLKPARLPLRDPERAAEFMQEHGADIVALNCGTGMDMERARQAVLRYAQVTDLPIMAQPNAGQPKLVDMKVVYDETPAQMVAGVVPLLQAGASIIGGCCGSTPDHIRAFREAMAGFRSAAANERSE